jgi:hypothetical protein
VCRDGWLGEEAPRRVLLKLVSGHFFDGQHRLLRNPVGRLNPSSPGASSSARITALGVQPKEQHTEEAGTCQAPDVEAMQDVRVKEPRLELLGHGHRDHAQPPDARHNDTP